jgi:hypothetical protein
MFHSQQHIDSLIANEHIENYYGSNEKYYGSIENYYGSIGK